MDCDWTGWRCDFFVANGYWKKKSSYFLSNFHSLLTSLWEICFTVSSLHLLFHISLYTCLSLLYHLSHSQSLPSVSSTIHPLSLRYNPFLSCYCSPIRYLTPPIPWPTHHVAFLLQPPFLLAFPSSFPSLPPSLLLLGHFLLLLRVTPHELFTRASQWGIFCCVSWPFTAQRQTGSIYRKAQTHVSPKCAGKHNWSSASHADSLCPAAEYPCLDTITLL